MRRATLLPLVLAASAAAGCSVHRAALPSPPPLPASYAAAPDPSAPAPTAYPQQWWKVFADPRLEALLDEALAENLQVEQAYARLEQLRASAHATGAAERPTLDLEGRASRDRQPGLTGDSTTDAYRLSLAAGYEVDLWRKLDARTEAAGLEAGASREDLEALYLSLSAQVADLYYLAREQGAQLELTDQTIASYRDTLERVERRYRAGLVPALDVYQARQNLAGARARRPQFEAGLAEARHALAVLLGRFSQDPPDVGASALPPAPPVPAAGIPADLLTRRPDVRAAHLRLAATDARVAAAVADRFPSFRLSGALGSTRSILESGTVAGAFWNLLAGLTQPVLDGGRRAAEVDRSRASLREAAAAYRETVLEAMREVEDALSAARATRERIAHLEEQVEATDAGLRLAKERYLQGLTDYLQVLTAQTLRFDSRSQLLAARRQLISDRIGLARALGGDWMEDRVRRREET